MSWYPENKEWLKARKAAWKQVKKSLDKMSFFDPSDKKLIKEYFVYGPEKEPLIRTSRWGETRHKVGETGLIAVWLHPSYDKKEVEQELKRFARVNHSKDGQTYYEGTGRFKDFSDRFDNEYINFDEQGEETSFFQKKERLLAELLAPKTVEEEPWFNTRLDKFKSNNDDERFQDTSSYYISRLAVFFTTEEPSSYYVPRFQLPYLFSAMNYILTIEENSFLAGAMHRLLIQLEKIKRIPRDYKPCQLETAQQLEHDFSELPDNVKEIIAHYRKQACDFLNNES